NSLLAGTTALPTDDFVFTVPINTPGGSLRGIELNYTQPFTFLPGILRDFGTQLNYTYVDSEMQYMLSSGALAQKDQLTGTSKTGWI
ncbi:hypothetical protein ACCS87_36505, partial [Rhizobium ruizarguesonis]